MSLFDVVRASAAAGGGSSLIGSAGSSVASVGLAARGNLNNSVRDAAAGSLGAGLSGSVVGGFAERLGINAPRQTPKVPDSGSRGVWTAAPHWGGLKGDEYYGLFRDSAMTAKSWKNLFWVSIEDRKPSGTGPADIGAMFNMLATDVAFGPITMPGEVVQIGGANIDKLTSADRTEMRITTLDDSRGTIKRWFFGKAAQAVDPDGSFGLPADYLVNIRVTHMAPTNQGSDDERMRHVYLMRPASIEIELSRSESALETLQMSFVQFDTFVEVR